MTIVENTMTIYKSDPIFIRQIPLFSCPPILKFLDFDPSHLHYWLRPTGINFAVPPIELFCVLSFKLLRLNKGY
jgi:hypothetical protein